MKLLAILLLISAPAFAQEEATAAASEPNTAKVAEILAQNEHDVIIGDENAPNTLVEYSSLSCSHCADFHNNVLPALKEGPIKDGTLRLINRDFPLNGSAFTGAKIAQCAPEGKKAKFYEVLFKLQDKWAFNLNYEDSLRKIAAVGGLDKEAVDACLADEALEERLLKQRQIAGENLNIQGTPSFFLNGEPFTAPLHAEEYSKALSEKLK
jgi:protein-disulfide isomerase